MTATLEQTHADLFKLIDLARKGEEVLITDRGQAVARLTGVMRPQTSPNRQAWLARLAGLRERLATGKTGPTVEQILDEDRGE